MPELADNVNNKTIKTHDKTPIYKEATPAMRSHNRKLALSFAAAGAYVFPTEGFTKKPCTLAWQHARGAVPDADYPDAEDYPFLGATTDAAVVRKMWDKYPDAVPSISLGPTHLYACDCDTGV